MNRNNISWTVLLSIICIVMIGVGMLIGLVCTREFIPITERGSHYEASTTERIDSTSVVGSELFESVYDYIFQLRIAHPSIVMAQCIEESGCFTSKIFLEGHNCLGMKLPSARPTHAVGVYRGHARYRGWHDCIADYALWQTTYARGLTDDEYYTLLDRVYAERAGYSSRLKAIIRRYGL